MCQRQPRCPQREPDRFAAGSITAWRMRENRAYVRTLLAQKQPEFARVLAAAEQELECQHQQSARSAASRNN